MPGILLPPAIAAKGFIDVSIPISVGSGTAAAGYPAVIAPVTANLVLAIASITAIQAALLPTGAIAPPSRIGLNITGAALGQITVIQIAIAANITAAAIPATVAAGVVIPAGATVITTSLTSLSAFIQTCLITPQLI
jgi:hypothetical protein